MVLAMSSMALQRGPGRLGLDNKYSLLGALPGVGADVELRSLMVCR